MISITQIKLALYFKSSCYFLILWVVPVTCIQCTWIFGSVLFMGQKVQREKDYMALGRALSEVSKNDVQIVKLLKLCNKAL